MDSPSSEGDPGPRIHRPVPRRPFNLNFTNATPPPDEDSAPSTPPISANDLRFLDPRFQQQLSPDSSLSRATSFKNLTSSTLSGIYEPTTPGACDSTTPWGTGAETPAVPYTPRDRRPSPPPPPGRRSSLALRAALLFALGMGYGALVTRLPANGRLPHPTATAWPYLALWGLAGVALGSLLPWFDRVWEETFGAPREAPRPLPRRLSRHNTGAGGGEADWALVVRGIGAFVGIVFAIRRLPWTSTMQASLTLALANPFLWYLIDRSKPGFLLSAAVGVAGSAVVVGTEVGGGVVGGWGRAVAAVGNGTVPVGGEGGRGVLGGREAAVETGVWVVSVLFCSCVCFGNIGRRLALNGEGVVRGRWGGVR